MKDWQYYLGLITMLSLTLGSFLLFDYRRQFQIMIVLLAGLLYVLWGFFYHQQKKDFHWRVLLEYLAVAIFASLAVIFLLLRT